LHQTLLTGRTVVADASKRHRLQPSTRPCL